MKKRLLLLILLLFFLCGCDATVNLNITGNSVNEEITITAFPDNEHYTDANMLLHSFRDYIPAFGSVPIVDTEPDVEVSGVKYYQKSVSQVGSGYNFIYKYNYQLSNYKDATSVKEGFKSVSIDNIKQDGTIRFSTDNAGLIYFKNYPSLNNVTVNVTTDYEVLENNADSINGNVYTWKFDKNTRKGIYLLLGEKKEESQSQNQEAVTSPSKSSSGKTTIFDKHPLLFGILGIVALFVVMWFFSKIKG